MSDTPGLELKPGQNTELPQKSGTGMRGEFRGSRHRKYGWKVNKINRKLGETQAQLTTATAERDEALERELIDPLTGLLSVKGFDKRLVEEISRAKRENKQMAVLVLDLNGLKEINDTLGHEVGDQRIIAVANVLTSSFRPTDLVARRGNKADEFLVALEVDNLDQVKEWYQRVAGNSKQLSENWEGIPMILPAGASLLNFSNINGSISAADTAMYEAKQASKLSNQNTISLSLAQPEKAA